MDSDLQEINEKINELAFKRAEQIIDNLPVHIVVAGGQVDIKEFEVKDGEIFIELDELCLGKAWMEAREEESVERNLAGGDL